jgi:hypothetical protein
VRPDIIVCRRVADFPDRVVPAGLSVAPCSSCDHAIAFDPSRFATPAPAPRRVCWQCAGFVPHPDNLNQGHRL